MLNILYFANNCTILEDILIGRINSLFDGYISI